MTIDDAILKVRRTIGAIGKGDKNEFHNFMYRSVDRVLDKVGPAMAEHDVNCHPTLQNLESRDITTSKGKREREVTVTVAYTYRHAGETLVTVVPGEASDAGDKAVSKAMSVALRTAHIQTFQIPTGETDPDQHSIQRGEDLIVKLKTQIWAEAKNRDWVTDDSYQKLADDFSRWDKTGGGAIEEADEANLRKYLAYLKPTQRMQRPKPGESS